MKEIELEPVCCPEIPADFHHKLRSRFLNKLKEVAHKEQFEESVSLFKGITSLPTNYGNREYLVEQESTFWYLFGVKQTDCIGLIHNDSGKTVLFVPEYSEDQKLWRLVKNAKQMKQEYQVDQVISIKKLRSYLEQKRPGIIYLLSGIESKSKLKIEEPNQEYIKGFKINRDILWPVISNLQAVKTSQEVELIKYVCMVTSEALFRAVRAAKPGLKETLLHSVFQFHHSIRSGSTQLAFNSISASGRNCAILNYNQKNKIIEPEELVLLDMGGRWYGYGADQAITFPVSGEFSIEQRYIYSAVLQTLKAVKAVVKAGVSWKDMHLAAQKVILKHLLKLGIINKYSQEQLQQHRIVSIFFPHRIGHFFGLKVHDLGYECSPYKPEKQNQSMNKLQTGMCITLSPGIYFIEHILETTLDDPLLSKYLNIGKLLGYRLMGGVRLKDSILVTKYGYQLLTHLPREIDDVQKMLAEM